MDILNDPRFVNCIQEMDIVNHPSKLMPAYASCLKLMRAYASYQLAMIANYLPKNYDDLKMSLTSKMRTISNEGDLKIKMT